MTRTEILDLNDDVLRLIFSHIPCNNIMKVALTCRRFHDLAIERIIAVVRIRSMGPLRRLCEYALSLSRCRAVYIEDLSLCTMTHEDMLARVRVKDVDALVGELLDKAQNIRSIEIYRFANIMKKCSRARKALGTMPYLTEATLRDASEASLKVLPSLRRLRTLTLFVEASPAMEALVRVLAACPSLLTLTLMAKPSSGLPPIYSRIPLTTSLQELHLTGCSSCTLELVHFCPNLSTLIIQGIAPANGTQLKVIEQFPPKLRNVIVPSLPSFSIVEQSCVPGAVQSLRIGEDWSIFPLIDLETEDTARGALILALIRGTSPVGLLRFRLHAPLMPLPSPFWATLATIAPRLRFLDITISLRSGSCDIPDASWMDLLLNSLRSLPLVCLKLYLPNIETDMQHLAFNHWEDHTVYSDPKEARKIYKQRHEEAIARFTAHRKGVAQAMLEHTKDLPERLANALPNLKYLAFRSDALITMQDPQTCSIMTRPSVHDWYKAVTHGEKKAMVAIPSRKGESIWKKLQDGDLGTAENIQ